MRQKKSFLYTLIQKKLKRTAVIVVLLGSYMFVMNLLTGASCIIRSSIGLPCPGCGMTRAYARLFMLDIRGAFAWHPMFWAVPALFAAWLCNEYIAYITTKHPGRRVWFVWFYEPFILCVGAAVIIVFVIRMILLFPHTEPFTFNQNAFAPRIFRLVQAGFNYLFK